MNEYEQRIIISSLNNLRNKLIADGRYTDAVDDVLVKVVNAPIMKFKVRITEDYIMEKTIFEEMGATYHKENRYLISNLTLPPEEEKPVGI